MQQIELKPGDRVGKRRRNGKDKYRRLWIGRKSNFQ